MRPPKLIGLTGYAGSGKDTVREMLEVCGYNGFAFADPIRAMLATLLAENGIDDDKYMNTREFKEAIIPELGVSYRHMAQTLGTEWGRALHGDFWLRIAGSYMQAIEDDGLPDISEINPPHHHWQHHFVISDVRFANEAAWVRERGGVVWRVRRDVVQRVRPHASEAGIDDIAPDADIDNNGTLDALERAVMRLLHGTALESTPA